MKRGWLALLLPISCFAAVALIMIALGSFFTMVGGTGTIVTGIVILIGVPFLGLLLTRPADPYRPLIVRKRKDSNRLRFNN